MLAVLDLVVSLVSVVVLALSVALPAGEAVLDALEGRVMLAPF